MKSFRPCALVVCAGLSLVASSAAAQRLTPLPAVAAPDVVVASYNLPRMAQNGSGSAFTNYDPTAQPQPGPSETPDLIEGSSGPSQFQQAVESGCPDGGYESCGGCDACGRRSAWFGTIGGIVMGRTGDTAGVVTTLDGGGDAVLSTSDAGADWTGGWEINVGYISGGCERGPGFLFTYWGLAPMTGAAQVSDIGNALTSPLTTDPFFTNSASQRIERDDQAENYELSLVLGSWSTGRWTVAPYVGFRYFRFDEALTFSALQGGGDPNDPDDFGYFRLRNINNLYGCQFAALVNHQFTCRFGWYLTPKIGLYGNQMIGGSRNFLGDGTTIYNVGAHRSDFAVLGELNTGFNYYLRQNMFIYMGYRVVGVANVALTDTQMEVGLDDPALLQDIRSGDSLILHGVMVGGGWLF